MTNTTPLPVSPPALPASDRAFLGHPVGLAYLAFTEAWERYSYYAMLTMLGRYLVKQLLLPGHIENIGGFTAFRGVVESIFGPLSVVALGSQIVGIYSGLVYVSPILGGFLADRWLGRTRTVTLGALLMVLGHFLMAFDAPFLLALVCLLFGVGCFKGNLASQVGHLYGEKDLRRADAFQIYYIAVNAGVIIAPLTAGTLGEIYGWHYGFAAAGVGMVLGLTVYLLGRKWLPAEEKAGKNAAVVHVSLQRKEWNAVFLLILLLPVLACGSVGNQELFNSYLIWAPDHLDMRFFGQVMPTSWLITIDSVVSVSFLVLAVAFWRAWAKRFREPSEVGKIAIGLALSASGVFMLVIASQIAAVDGRASIMWAMAFHVLNAMGFANVFPVGLALYARAAPKAVSGTMIGMYFLHLFAGNFLVGWLGGLLERMPGAQFWLIHVTMVGGASLIFFLAWRFCAHILAPAGDAPIQSQ